MFPNAESKKLIMMEYNLIIIDGCQQHFFLWLSGLFAWHCQCKLEAKCRIERAEFAALQIQRKFNHSIGWIENCKESATDLPL